MIAAGALFLACKPRQDARSAALRDLMAGQAASSGVSKLEDPLMRQKTPVLIYYANDTVAPLLRAPAFTNLYRLISMLEEGGRAHSLSEADRKYLSSVASNLTKDWDDFRESVLAEYRSLDSFICGESPRFPVALAMFSNSMMQLSETRADYDTGRSVRWLSCENGQRHGPNDWRVPWFGDFRYDSQPLSHPSVFKQALEEVRNRFPPAKYRYILVTKSHGSAELAMTPNLVADISSITQQDLWKSILTHRDKAGQGELSDIKVAYPLLSSLDGVNAALANYAGNGARPIGVSKLQYLETLVGLDRSISGEGMYFPIVFMESCKSDLRLSTNPEIREALEQHTSSYAGLELTNVGLLYASDHRGLPYRTMNYQDLFKGFSYRNLRDMQDAVRYQLDTIAADHKEAREVEAAAPRQ